MNSKSLLKGIEIEQFTGNRKGEVIALSGEICNLLPEFTVEPDGRNVEFTSIPCLGFADLKSQYLKQRIRLREALESLDENYTIIPGSSIPLKASEEITFSKPDDPYHRFIASTYGFKVVTSSIHINIGVDDPEEIVRLTDLLRMEASLLLALSASSPFHQGVYTGYQSYRWASFPKVPTHSPIFGSYSNYRRWMEESLAAGELFNPRHHWASVRPNGTSKPDDLNRVELRIADLPTDPDLIVALTAWVEMRARYFLARPDLCVPEEDQLALLADENEGSAAIFGLSGHFSDWLLESETSHYEAVQVRLSEAQLEHAGDTELLEALAPLESVLQHGSESSRLLGRFYDGLSVDEVIEEWIGAAEAFDYQLTRETISEHA